MISPSTVVLPLKHLQEVAASSRSSSSFSADPRELFREHLRQLHCQTGNHRWTKC